MITTTLSARLRRAWPRTRQTAPVEPAGPGRPHRLCLQAGCGSIVFGDCEQALQVALDRHVLSCHIVGWTRGG